MEINFKQSAESEADLATRNEIVKNITERGFILKREASWLMNFDRKMRVCNTCGKSVNEARGWRTITIPDKYGNELEAGLAANCFFCELEDIMSMSNEQ